MTEYRKSVIVDSMGNEDILSLLGEDIAFLQHKIDDNIKTYRKLARSSMKKERVFYKPLNYKSARGFNYVIQFFKRGVDEEQKDKLGIIYYTWFVKNRGIYAILFSRSSAQGRSFWRYTIYTPHFLDRYRERFLKDITISKPDVIHRYVINNLKTTLTGHPSEKYPNSIWVLCSDGLCLCNHINGFNLEAKTFVTFDMAGLERQQFIEKAKGAMQMNGFEFSLPEDDFNEYVEETSYL